MSKKLPGPREPYRQIKCPWCKQEFMTLQGAQAHEPKCLKRPSNCKHPWSSRRKEYMGIVTIWGTKYKVWKVKCNKCGAYFKNKRKKYKGK